MCGSEKLAAWLICHDNLISNKEFDLVRCPECGFILTQDPPEENMIASYYQADEYISHNPEARGILSAVYRITRDFMMMRKRRHLEIASGIKKGSLLDIGCGTGHFANTMKKAGWQVMGIEPGEKARNYAAREFGLKVLPPDKISELPDQNFDFVTMWHVMEHFHDPFGYTSEVRRLLKPGGLWLTALPNSSSFDATYYLQNWAAWDVPRHLWHFNPGTLAKFADKAGFRIIGTGVLPLDVFYISILSEKARGASLPFIKGFSKGLWFSARTLFDKSKSSSLYYLLKPV